MSDLKIRPSQKGDLEEVLKERWGDTFRGITVVEDGRVVGVVGVMHGRELQAFSTITIDPRQDLRLMVKGVRQYRELLSHYDLPVYAAPDPDKETAEGFLQHVGFKKREDGLYVWTR
jgi:hypothetical protein